ncbi:MAG: hypothetical protein ACRD96_05465 [Bryobacteraceae bacterium]
MTSLADHMTDKNEFFRLRLVESPTIEGTSDEYLHIEAAVEVGRFAGSGLFVSRPDILLDFVAQLGQLAAGRTASATLECGLVGGSEDVVYFSCQIDQVQPDCDFAAQISVGATGSKGLLNRLHVGLRVSLPSIEAFQAELKVLVEKRIGSATVWPIPGTQPNKRLQPAAGGEDYRRG